ncbi:MAG: translation initiation factor IF-1 [Patescibacteria group bacterium]
MQDENKALPPNNAPASQTQGVVEEALPNTLFRVKLEDGTLQLSYLAGKMRLHRIKVLVGDRVTLQLDKYGGKARIVKRS